MSSAALWPFAHPARRPHLSLSKSETLRSAKAGASRAGRPGADEIRSVDVVRHECRPLVFFLALTRCRCFSLSRRDRPDRSPSGSPARLIYSNSCTQALHGPGCVTQQTSPLPGTSFPTVTSSTPWRRLILQAGHNGPGMRDAKWSDLHEITVPGYAQFGSSPKCRCRRCLAPRRVGGAARDLLGAAGGQEASGQEQATRASS